MAAMALCGMVTPAMAQSNVSMYGTIDTGVLSMSNYSAGIGYLPTKAHGGSAMRLRDGGLGGSHFGFKGSEDLGGGLRANFQIQGLINSANGVVGGAGGSGQPAFFNQLTVVGMSGGFGDVKLGRQFSPVAFAMQFTDPRGFRYFGSTLTALVGMNSASKAWIGDNSNTAFGTVYNDNALRYTTPTWNNLVLDFAYSFGEGSGKANSQQSVAAMYNANGLKLSALYYNGYGNNFGTAKTVFTAASGGNATAGANAAAAAGFSPTANTNRLCSVGAMYTFSDYTVAGQYYAARNPDHTLMPGGSASLDMWNIGGGWRPMPLVNITAAYYHVKDNTNIGNKSTQFVIGAEYFLSKRTWLYVNGAMVTNKGANMALSPMYATPVAADKNVHAFMVGVRHSY